MESNMFEQFEGADLDRLMECLKAIKAEGLKVDKYCQAGINQSSGNVYIYSEDWIATVYCSIGFDVAWSYSCPNCGDETDYDTLAEAREAREADQEANEEDGNCPNCR